MYYTLTTTGISGSQNYIVLNNGNGSYTTFLDDPTNPNYLAYQAWLDKGNTPEPAEEQQ
jgi:hypothetical protein